MELLEKWKEIIDQLNVKNDLRELKLAKYAEHFSNIEKRMDTTTSLLPINLRVMSKLNFYELTDDPSVVKDHTVSMNIPINIVGNFPFVLIPLMEEEIEKFLIEKYKNKRLLIYMMVHSVQVITEKTMVPKLFVTSKIDVK